MKVALEALREGLRQTKASLNEIQRFARAGRVERIPQLNVFDIGFPSANIQDYSP